MYMHPCVCKFVCVHMYIYIYIYSLLKYQARSKEAYSQNTIQLLKTYIIIKLHKVHNYVIYNDSFEHNYKN